MQAASSGRATALLFLALALLAVARPSPTLAAGELTVAVVGAVDSSSYPLVRAEVSVVLNQSGSPLPALTSQNFTVVDLETGVPARDVKVTASTSEHLAASTSYVLLVDTSAGAAPHMDRIREAVLAFLDGLGSNDSVRLVYFNVAPESRTGTQSARDPVVRAQAQALGVSTEVAEIGAAINFAAAQARETPPTVKRRAVVLFTAIDDGRAVPRAEFTPEHISALQTPVHVLAFGNAESTEQQRLTNFLEQDLVLRTVGAYVPMDSTALQVGLSRVFELARRTWTVEFTTDVLPTGQEHDFGVAVTDAQQTRSGKGQGRYRAGTLRSVSPFIITGLADGDRISADREVTIELGGTRNWNTYTIDLFRNCDPRSCTGKPLATATNRALRYRLSVGPLDQGTHIYWTRVTAVDGQGRSFSDVTSTTVDRSGTTFNYGALVLLAGVAAAAVGVTAIAVRKRLR